MITRYVTLTDEDGTTHRYELKINRWSEDGQNFYAIDSCKDENDKEVKDQELFNKIDQAACELDFD